MRKGRVRRKAWENGVNEREKGRAILFRMALPLCISMNDFMDLLQSAGRLGREEAIFRANPVGSCYNKMNHAIFIKEESTLRLKSLELQGFKSFQDKTLPLFPHPITAIVGPNGSSKSNLSDAIRWVLGASLPGPAVRWDVIFGGAQDRRALPVTLTLEAVPGPDWRWR